MIYSLIFCCKKSKLDNYLVCLAAEYRIYRSDFQHQPISNPGKYSFNAWQQSSGEFLIFWGGDSTCPRIESQNVHYSIYLTFHKSYFLSLQQSIYIIPTSTYLTKSEQAINIFPTFSHDLTLWLNKNCSYKIPINQCTWNVCMISCLLGLAVVALLICLLM